MAKGLIKLTLMASLMFIIAGCQNPINIIFKKSPPKYPIGEEYSIERRKMLEKHIAKSDLVVDGRVVSLQRDWVQGKNLKASMLVKVRAVRKGTDVETIKIFIHSPESDLGRFSIRLGERRLRFYLKALDADKNEYRFFAEPHCEEISEDVEW